METITLQKLMVPELVKNSPAYYGIQRSITVFVRANEGSLS